MSYVRGVKGWFHQVKQATDSRFAASTACGKVIQVWTERETVHPTLVCPECRKAAARQPIAS